MLNIWPLVFLWLITFTLIGALSLFHQKAILALAIVQILSFVIGCIGSVGFTLLLIAGVRGKKLTLDQTFKQIWPLLLKMIGLTIIVSVALSVSLLLLIVPFFFVLPRLMLADYYLVDKNMGVFEAFQASWENTKGYSMKVWGIIGVNILMALLFVGIIGIPVAIYLLVMYGAAFAVIYEFISKKQPAVAAGVKPVTVEAKPTAPATTTK